MKMKDSLKNYLLLIFFFAYLHAGAICAQEVTITVGDSDTIQTARLKAERKHIVSLPPGSPLRTADAGRTQLSDAAQ